MGYDRADIDAGEQLLAEIASEARRRAGSNYLLDNRWFPPEAYVRAEAAALDEGRVRAVILLPAGKGWIVDILIDGAETEAVFPSLPAFVRTRDEALDKGFICLCALFQTIFARRVAEQGDGGLPVRSFDLMGHPLRITGAMQVRAGLLTDYFGGSEQADDPSLRLLAAAEPFLEEGHFSAARWQEARKGDRALVHFYAAALVRSGIEALAAPADARS
ncbi:hypothetical protein [Cereibacter sediminicola]|uniref:hypothetical protein n=1 Tax=Cereibacter sediminicola TaxID=2584941 RepID=UPI0011A07431|nr:hypothetical protein [Cereibacter sediminicola]